MTTSTAPPAAPMLQEWKRLAAGGPPPEPFDPDMVVDLPEPARRWLAHAIAPGTPLWRSVELEMHGTIKIKGWRPFTATQVIAPPEGYIWAARASVYGLPVTGYDRLSSGSGEMRWRLLGVVPVVTASGPDLFRSAAGRLASEIALLPTAFQMAAWRLGDAPDTAVATWQIGAESIDVALHVAPDGRLLDVLLQRWSDAGGAFGYVPFGVACEQERTFDGVTIPSDIRAGWWWGTDREAEGAFFRAEITSATHR